MEPEGIITVFTRALYWSRFVCFLVFEGFVLVNSPSLCNEYPNILGSFLKEVLESKREVVRKLYIFSHPTFTHKKDICILSSSPQIKTSTFLRVTLDLEHVFLIKNISEYFKCELIL
jgi:hypothetical protein